MRYNGVMKIEKCINYLLTQVQIKVNQTFKENLSACSITPAQYVILYYLWEEDGLTPTQLAAASGLDASTVTGLLSRLEEKALLLRKHSTDDRRGVNVYLTEAGAALEPDIDRIIGESNQEVLACLDERERDVLKVALNKLLDDRRTAEQNAAKGN